MRILFSIAVFMMHTMHHAIGSRYKERRTLHKPCEEVYNFFTILTCGIHLVGSVTV